MRAGRGVHVHRPGPGGHPSVGRDLEHVAHAEPPNRSAQLRVGAVHLVCGHPAHRCPDGHRPFDHLPSQGGLGGELDVVRNAGGDPPVTVVDPAPGQVQRPVDEPLPAPRRIGEEHPALGVLDPPRGAGVLALHSDRVGALLQVTGLVDHQHRVRVGERLDDVAPQHVARLVDVPLHPGQQMLQRVRAGVTPGFGDRPAVLTVQGGQHAQYQRRGVAQRLVPGEQRCDPVHQAAERPLPPVGIYSERFPSPLVEPHLTGGIMVSGA